MAFPLDVANRFGMKTLSFRLQRRWVWLAIASLVVYLSINWMTVWNLTAGLESRAPLKSLVQALVILIGFLSATLGALALKGVGRWLFVAAFAASITCNLAAWHIMRGPLVRGTAVWLSTEIGQTGNLMGAWGTVILGLAVISVLAVLLWAWLANGIRSHLENWLGIRRAAFVRVAAVFTTLALPVVGGFSEVRMGLAESNIYGYGIVAFRLGSPPAPSLSYSPANSPAARKIVFVIDESTRPDTFDEVVLPSLKWPLVSYGSGYSLANCSAASNTLLRLGVYPARIGTTFDPRTQPSIWLFAKQAGFKTVLIDGQLADAKKSQNFIGGVERSLIDDYVAADIGLATDLRISEQLIERMKTAEREFIVIVKRGNHFPYDANLPATERNGAKTMRDVYRILVQYTTARFFETLQKQYGKLEDILIFYTSDHGQFHGGGNTHCRSDRPEDEYLVPIIVAGGSDYLLRLSASRSCWEGKAHHQSLRSSIIEAMGYSAEQLMATLYPPFSECPSRHEIPRFVGYLPFPTSGSDKLIFEKVTKPDGQKNTSKQ